LINSTVPSIPFFYKPLIVTTGKDLTKFLDTLTNTAKYTGDVLIITYPDDNIEILKQYKNIIQVNTTQVYSRISHDRFRAFYEALVNQHIGSMYDIIMCIDGDDVWFNGNLEELFNMATDRMCYVAENKTNDKWHPYADDEDIEYWEYIKDKPLINCGMFIGPRELIFQILEYMYKYMKTMKKKNDHFGIDMYLFNCMIHYFNIPSREVDVKWNTSVFKNKYKRSHIIIHCITTVIKGELIDE